MRHHQTSHQQSAFAIIPNHVCASSHPPRATRCSGDRCVRGLPATATGVHTGELPSATPRFAPGVKPPNSPLEKGDARVVIAAVGTTPVLRRAQNRHAAAGGTAKAPPRGMRRGASRACPPYHNSTATTERGPPAARRKHGSRPATTARPRQSVALQRRGASMTRALPQQHGHDGAWPSTSTVGVAGDHPTLQSPVTDVPCRSQRASRTHLYRRRLTPVG
jgi:hypothetical protein